MKMSESRIHYFHDELIKVFGSRVQKICLDGGFTCPNRDGTKAVGGCTFCDASGSGAAHIARAADIRSQVAQQIDRCRARYGTEQFIAYFQAFTNTYAPVDRLRELYDAALEDPRVVGLSVGTRADCIDEEVCALLRSYRDSRRVWVEIGIQTINQTTLDAMNRAETVDEYRLAARLVKSAGLELVVHVIFGLPGETEEDALATIAFVNEIGADGIKIHNLYIDSHAPIAKQWREGRIELWERQRYTQTVADALELLRWECAVHRLTGQAPRSRHFAPIWALEKTAIHREIESILADRGTYQGCRAESSSRRLT